MRLYKAVVKPTLTYSCEVWTITAQMEKRLLYFENKVLRRIRGAVYDGEFGYWRKTKAEIREITQMPEDKKLHKSTTMAIVQTRYAKG